MPRKHFMSIHMLHSEPIDTIEVTCVDKDGQIEVLFEQAVESGFNDAVLLLDATVVSNEGYNDEYMDYFKYFVVHYVNIIRSKLKEEA